MSTTTRSHYQTRIAETLANTDEADDLARLALTPAHVEAWMRVEHDTLDALAGRRWTVEVLAAARCAVAAGSRQSEALAASYGL